jgi:hypothetical protein
VVVSLIGSAAPGFADGPTGGRADDRGAADRRTDLVGEVHEKLDQIRRGRDGGNAPAATPAGSERAALTAAPAAAPAANGRTEAPAPLAAPVVGLTAPVVAPTAPESVPATPSAPEAPSPAPLADVLLSSAPLLAPPAGAAVPASSPTAPVEAASPAAAPAPDAPAPAQVDAAPPPTGKDAGGERRAESPRSVAERSFTALLLLMAAVLVFLAVHGRLDRRDPKLGDRPRDFRRFR